MIKLFGFKIGKDDVMEVEDPNQRSFTLPNEALDDGAVTVTQNAYFGTYVDLEGSVRNELELITRYREMSNHPELEAAIDDIVNEAITHEDDGTVVDINLDKLKLPDNIKKKIHEEFYTILKLLNFSNLADDLFKRWYIDGRIYFHILVNEKNPKEGIQELRYIDPRKIRKIREINKDRDPTTGANVIKSMAEYYIYNDKGTSTQTYTAGTTQGVKIAPDAIINVNSGLMDAKNTFVISYLHKCVVGNARIRTNSGWKYVLDIEPGDEIYSYNQATNELEKTKVVNKWSTGIKNVVSIKSRHTELTCTDDHPIFVKDNKTGTFNYIEPKNIIPKRHQICLPKITTFEKIKFPALDRKFVCKVKYPENWIESGVQGKQKIIFSIADSLNENRNRIYAFVYGYQSLEKSIAEKVVSLLPVELELYEKYEGWCINPMYLPEYIDEDFARLFGFLIGDGWINPTAIGFSEGIYPELNEKYSELMVKYFGNCSRVALNSRKSEYSTFYTNNTLGCELLKKMGFITGATKKRIPEWVFRASKEIKLAFIEGLCDADGCDRTEQYGGIWASTVNLANEKLIYDIKELWTQIGYSSGKIYVAKQKPTNINGVDVKNFSGAWAINLSKKLLQDFENVIAVDEITEPQEVFDIEVEHSEHNFVVNGIVVHNCIRPLNMLRMIEDAIVVYRVSRAPERRVFYIDVGNLPKGKAEQYLRDVMVKYRNKMVYDPQTGSMRNDIKHVSMLEDFYLPRREGCLARNLHIKLLDGRDVKLEDLITEYKIGKQNWVYSVSPEGKVVPGKITWAGYTRKDAEVIDVHLDNGEVITVTPDHKFVLRNGTKLEAKDLQPGTSLMPLYTKITEEGNLVYDNFEEKYVNFNETITKFKLDNNIKPKGIRAYKKCSECDTLIEAPSDNVHFKSKKTCSRVCFSKRRSRLYNKDKIYNYKGGAKTKTCLQCGVEYKTHKSTKKYCSNACRNAAMVKREYIIIPCRNCNKDIVTPITINREFCSVECRNTFYSTHKSVTMQANRRYYRVHTKIFEKVRQEHDNVCLFCQEPKLEKNLDVHHILASKLFENINDSFAENNLIPLHSKCHQFRFEDVLATEWHKKGYIIPEKNAKMFIDDLVPKIQQFYEQLWIDYSDSNEYTSFEEYLNDKKSKTKNIVHIIDHNHFNCHPNNLIAFNNINEYWKYCKQDITKHFEQLLQQCNYNHKVVKVVPRSDRMDVGTLTIDENHEYHDYHNFALTAGVFVMNSRGTEITTLPGGTSLGETGDVDYFKKKLLQALNVPYSRMEPDGGGFASMGKSAEITRDELKFAKFITRLRNKFSQIFDHALRVQLSLKGICSLEEWDDFKEDIYFDFRKDNNFTELRESELIRERLITLQQVDPYIGRYFSQTWIKKNVLRMSDEEIADMDKEMEKDGSLEIMQQQIEAQNPGMQQPPEPIDNTYDRESIESMTPHLDKQVSNFPK